MWRLSVLALLASAAAQIPSLGWCPDYQPMANFNMKRFLGTWFEAERYFTVTELGSRCVATKYEATPEGRILVSNEITNSITGMKRLMDGSLQLIGREGEGRVIIKYASVPIPYDNEYSVLGTDYDNYAIMWSCSGIGPVHTQNAWVMTRDRIAPTNVMQAAYGVLDKYKISRAFFVKTNQADCGILPETAVDPYQAKNAANLEVLEKHAGVVVPEPNKLPVVEVPKLVEPEIKPEIPQERVAGPLPVPEEIKKPMQVPELLMSETSEKKEEMIVKAEDPIKEEKPAIAESSELKEKPLEEKL